MTGSTSFVVMHVAAGTFALGTFWLSAMLRKEHGATLLAVNRGGKMHNNLTTDFKLEPGDDLVVVAESLGDLQPLQDSPA